jgi:transposase-like protein
MAVGVDEGDYLGGRGSSSLAKKQAAALRISAEQIQASDPDLLRSMVKTMAETLMSAEADSRCGAAYGERSSERANRRNGYRTRDWDTRAGTVAVALLQALDSEVLGRVDLRMAGLLVVVA